MNSLRDAAQAALEALEAMQSYAAAERKGLRICDEAIPALRAALAQQAEPTWVCPDSPEHRYAKPGYCEDCGKTLVQEQGRDHCNHPLYAATKCRVCGRVTEQAEPLGWAVQIGTHSAGRRQGKPRYVLFFNKADAEDLADRTRGARPEPFYLEGQPSRTVPVYTAPPQRKPLTEEEIEAAAKSVPAAVYELMHGHEITVKKFRAALAEFSRAIERAHGIGEEK